MLTDARAQNRLAWVTLVVAIASLVSLTMFSYLWTAVPALHMVIWWGANAMIWVQAAWMVTLGIMSSRFS